ncbi:MAG: hypothetical protein KGS45_11090 [Planctomycetes bacterium]|nr:hypothetical protein [Planctomycetota bacterium]
MLAAIVASVIFAWQFFDRPPQLPTATAVRIDWPWKGTPQDTSGVMIVVREHPKSRDLLITSVNRYASPGKLASIYDPSSLKTISPIFCLSRADNIISQVDESVWNACKNSVHSAEWDVSYKKIERRTSRDVADNSLSPLSTKPAGERWYSTATSPKDIVLGLVSASGKVRKSGRSVIASERSQTWFEGPYFAELLRISDKSRLCSYELVGAPPYSNPTGTVWTGEGGWYIVYSSPDLFWAIPNPAK